MDKIPDRLVQVIKKIICDDPLDVYYEDSESYSTCAIELVKPRESDYGKLVGSANMLIAASILDFELTNAQTQTEQYSDEFVNIWKGLLDTFKEEGFLKDTPEAVREKIYLAVDNEVPDLGLKQHSCLTEGEHINECNNE